MFTVHMLIFLVGHWYICIIHSNALSQNPFSLPCLIPFPFEKDRSPYFLSPVLKWWTFFPFSCGKHPVIDSAQRTQKDFLASCFHMNFQLDSVKKWIQSRYPRQIALHYSSWIWRMFPWKIYSFIQHKLCIMCSRIEVSVSEVHIYTTY